MTAKTTEEIVAAEDPSRIPMATSVGRHLVGAVALAWFVIQAYMAYDPAAVSVVQQRVIHLGCALALASAMWFASTTKWYLQAVSLVLLVASVLIQLYTYFEVERQNEVQGLYEGLDLPVAIAGLVVVLFFTYRMFGWPMPVIGLVFIAWALWGDELPGLLAVVGDDFERLIPAIFYSGEGVHGVPLGASTQYIFMFIVFGSFLLEFGAGDLLNRVVRVVFRRSRGAAGKMSVASSLLFGVVSDSTTANVATTGSVMIPAMKRSGFRAEPAAAIESAGAVGGQIFPPVMGSVAFIMVSLTGIPYTTVIAAALIPALLYYLALYLAVDGHAARNGIGPAPADEDEDPVSRRDLWLDAIVMVVPLGFLIYLLVIARWEPGEAAVWSLGAVTILYLVRHRSVSALRTIVRATINGTKRAVLVAVITGAVGTIIGPVLISGLGLQLTGSLIDLSNGNMWALFVLTLLGSLVLGSGLPSTATYILLAILVAPPLVELGVPLLVIHMFIMYAGVLSDLSPPTMATVFVASGIAESKPMRTGMLAMGFGVAGLVVPFMFVNRDGLLMEGGPLAVVTDTVFAVLCVAAMAAAISGYLGGRLGLPARIACFAAGIALVPGGVAMTTAGLLLLALAAGSAILRGTRMATT
ncbi:TRAP transporter permease [Actinophytocola sediminis]